MSIPPTHLGEFRSFDELRTVQERQLAVVLERVARSPFYRQRFPHGMPSGLDEVAAVPLTSKADIRDNYPFGMLAVPRNRVATYHESSGSTGQRSPSYFTEQEWTELADRFNRKAIELSADDTVLVRMPYAMVMVGLLGQLGARARGATVVPGDCRTLAAPYTQIIRVMIDIGVTVTWSSPSECLILAAAAQAAGYSPAKDFPSLRALYVAGEPLSHARRQRIEDVWARPVVEEYGCTEIGPMGGSCPYGQMHFFADRVLPEVLDPDTGTIGREGVGNLVLTPLYREAMPLLRYDLEDRVEIRHEDCECGWYLPTLQVLGRVVHTHVVRGRALSPVQVEEAVFRLDAGYGVFFWRAQIADDRLHIQIEVSADHHRDACGELAVIATDLLDVPVEVSSVPPGTLVPEWLLTDNRDAMKPLKLFGPDQNWDGAVLRA